MSFLTRFRRSPRQEPATAAKPSTTDTSPSPSHSTTDTSAEVVPAEGAGVPASGRRWRLVAGRVLTILAGLLVLAALLLPNQHSGVVPGVFLRIPLEGIVGAAILLVLPSRPRKVVAALFGAGIGLLTIIKIIDMGFFATLARQFDLVADWGLLDDGLSVLTDSVGRVGAITAAVVVVLLALALVVLIVLAVLRLSRLMARHRTGARRTLVALVAAWAGFAVLGTQLLPNLPIAAASEAEFVQDRARLVRAGVHEQRRFATKIAADPFRDTPGDQLLTALRGKDVIFTWIESYGRTAVDNPGVGTVLEDGTRRLAAAGFATRSAYLTSPTFGGYSWLAHATLFSGMWINKQVRYRNLVTGDRLTLSEAFRRANWDTVAVEPAITYAWPEGDFYGFQRVYHSRNLGYRGPKFSWSAMPDQYTLGAFQRLEYGKPNRRPMMAEVTLTSSHTPWAPLPRLVDWNQLGDGTIFTPIAQEGDSPGEVWRDADRVRESYMRSVEYSLGSVISYVERYGNKNLVLLVLGDHQPAPIVTGEGASHDVPITIVTRDQAVLNRISGWGWQNGMRPGLQAPVTRMDTFRDQFLTTFGPQGGATGAPASPR